MARYALLIQPSANRVYSGASAALTRAELAVFSQSVLDGRIGDVSEAAIGGVGYVIFAADGLGDRDAAYLANLSSAYALFEVEGGLLRPVELRRDAAAAVLADAGLAPPDSGPYLAFRHRVDQAIVRDILIAVKP